MTSPIATTSFLSPIGWITLMAHEEWLISVKIAGLHGGTSIAPENSVLRAGHDQFDAWFAGTLTDFDLPLAPATTAEGAKLRAGIAAIAYGTTSTYGAIASATGSSPRGVGQACRTNPFPIIIPCHRVVSAAGPDYYSAGDGPRTKSWLVDFEYANLPSHKRTRLL
jgi:methylated-DNA-[protein]-cysteine S-methyltransferase